MEPSDGRGQGVRGNALAEQTVVTAIAESKVTNRLDAKNKEQKAFY